MLLERSRVKIADNSGAMEVMLFAVNGKNNRQSIGVGDVATGSVKKASPGSKIDQIANVVNDIKNNPNSRRMIVSAWNPSVMPDTSISFADNVANGKAALPPCHAFFQFYVADGKLSCHLYQRSGDIFLGVPFNIASYSLLTMMMAQVTGLEPGDFVHTLGDAHIYNDHVEQVKTQLSRKPKKQPKMEINPDIKDIFEFNYSDFTLSDYDPHPRIKAPISL